MTTDTIPPSADVVIVGGAIMGAAVAWQLGVLGGGRLRIVVVERDMSYQGCATTRSAGGVRLQFSTPENIAMSQATLELVRWLKSDGGLNHRAAADLAFRAKGYLLLASGVGTEILKDNVALQRRHGAATALLDCSALAARFPWLDATGLVAGGFGGAQEGWLDPASLLALFKSEAQANGARFVSGTVVAIDVTESRVTAVQLVTGERITCGDLVNAAGPWAGAVASLAGIALPVEPRKRFVFVLDCRDPPPELYDAPLTVDPTGIWFRPEGRRFICGASPGTEADEPPPDDLDAIDHALFENRIWPALAARVSALAAVKVASAWAGHYDFNTFDQNAVLGPHPQIMNFHFCNGFSGHGLQHAYAAGRAVAERIVAGRFLTLDLTRLGYERIVQGAPLFERNVI